MSVDSLLSVRGLKKHYPITEGILKREVGRVRAVDGIDFDLDRGETLGLVGESGCGKSTAATTLLGLEAPTAGEVRFDGEDVTTYDGDRLRRFRRRAQMIFQDPTSSFDPRMSIGESVAEPLAIHGMRDRERRRGIVCNLLERVGLSESDYDRYPHSFSGGQKQRIALARALVVNPDLIVADEPVSALDVSVQAEILALMDDIQREFDLSILLISHDVGVVRQVCDRVAVMYLGEIVELAPVEELFETPQHPYTRALLSSVPVADPRRRERGVELTGDVPDPSNPPSGCRFHTRCPEVIPPEEYDFEGDNWRRVMDLRGRLTADEVDPDAFRELVAEREDREPATISDEALARAIRAEFDLPECLSDPEAERVLADAISSIVASDTDKAATYLSGAFPTVCERENPAPQETDAGHPAACHLHDRSVVTGEAKRTPQPED